MYLLEIVSEKEKVKRKTLWQNLSEIDHPKKFILNFEVDRSERYLNLSQNQLDLLTGDIVLK